MAVERGRLSCCSSERDCCSPECMLVKLDDAEGGPRAHSCLLSPCHVETLIIVLLGPVLQLGH